MNKTITIGSLKLITFTKKNGKVALLIIPEDGEAIEIDVKTVEKLVRKI